MLINNEYCLLNKVINMTVIQKHDLEIIEASLSELKALPIYGKIFTHDYFSYAIESTLLF